MDAKFPWPKSSGFNLSKRLFDALSDTGHFDPTNFRGFENVQLCGEIPTDTFTNH